MADYPHNLYLPDDSESIIAKSHVDFTTTDITTVPTDKLPGNQTIWSSFIGDSEHYMYVLIGPDAADVPLIPAALQQFKCFYIHAGSAAELYTIYDEIVHGVNDPFWNVGRWYLDSSHTQTTLLRSGIVRFNSGLNQWQVGTYLPSDTTSGDWSGDYRAYGDGVAAYIIESTIPITANSSSYDPREHDEHIFTKDPDVYSMHVGVRCNELSATPTYNNVYESKDTLIKIRWTSPVTGTTFVVPLDNLIYNEPHYTVGPSMPAVFNFSTTHTIGSTAKALRMPLGSFTIVPTEYEDLSDVPALSEISLQDLKAAAQTQQGNVINNDLFTVLYADFYNAANNQLIITKSVDFSSLFGEDIDIGGNTVLDPNGDPSLTDDNVYTDHIDLNIPTLTATGIFNRCYTLDGNSVNDLCDFLYNANDSIFEEIIDGVLTRGNPIESLIDLRLYPFDVRTFTGAGTSESIKFGRTDTGVIGIKLPQDAQAVIDLGHCTIPRYYNNFLDYQTQAQLYIPFCGVVDLPIDRILNHELSIKLIVDYITGAGTAVVFVDKIPLLYQQGVIGISIPMTATNSAEFGKTIAGNLINTATAAASGNVGAALSEGSNALINGYEGSHIMKIGSSSPQTSLFQPKNAYVLLSMVSPANGVYENEYAAAIGYACFMPVSAISWVSGSGFTVFDNVKLQLPQATSAEREELLSLLTSGVFM